MPRCEAGNALRWRISTQSAQNRSQCGALGRRQLAHEVSCREQFVWLASGLDHHPAIVDHWAIVCGAHWVTCDCVRPGTGGGTGEANEPRHDGNGFNVAATDGVLRAMAWQLAFDTGFETIRSARGIAAVVAWRTIDAFDEWIGIGLVMVGATRTLTSDGAKRTAAFDIGYVRDSTARGRRTRNAASADSFATGASSSSRSAGWITSQNEVFEASEELASEASPKNHPGQTNVQPHNSVSVASFYGFVAAFHGLLRRRRIFFRVFRTERCGLTFGIEQFEGAQTKRKRNDPSIPNFEWCSSCQSKEASAVFEHRNA